MKEYILLLLLIGFNLEVNAQLETCNCKSDLMELNQRIENLPSYKINKLDYKEAYIEALNKTTINTPLFDCFAILNKLLIPLNDWHMGMVGKATDSLNRPIANYPVYAAGLEELNLYLKDRAFEEFEGIYYLRNNVSFGLVFNENKKVYDAVILHSESEKWNEGDIVYKLVPLTNDFFKVIGAQYPSKKMISYHERISKGVFLRAGFKKDTTSKYFMKSPYPKQDLLFKEISPNIDYLKVGSFSSRYPFLKEAEDFYASLEGKFEKPHLILDLRDNGGGGDRNSDLLFKPLRKYAKKNTLHIITNASTGSNAEQFTVKLKKYDNVISYGDKTKGSLSYEVKPNDYYTLPSSGFMVILPSKAHKKYLKYETVGVTPDLFLDYTSSWISMVVNYIENNN